MICNLQKDFEQALKILSEDTSNTSQQDWLNEISNQKPSHVLLREKLKDSPHLERIFEECFGYGPLAPLLQNDEVSEIIVNKYDQICFERNGRIEKFEEIFLSPWSFHRFAKLIAEEGLHKVDLENPFASFSWKSFRVHLVHPPLNPNGFSLTLRRLSKNNTLSWDHLKEMGWAAAEEMELLQSGLEMKKNILMVGTTGSGKTTVLSSLLSQLPECERIVVLEDTDELALPNPASTKLLTRSQGPFPPLGLGRLVKESLRMRPDRIVVGEIRGGEASELLMALATGHRGSMGTIHAQNAVEALLRLEMLVQMGAPTWSIESIRRLMQLSIDWIVVVERVGDKRKLQGIFQISSLEPNGFLVDLVEPSAPPLRCLNRSI